MNRSALTQAKIKQLTVIAITFMLLAGLSPVASKPVAAAPVSSPFTDMKGHWGASTIGWAYEKGIVDGYDDGSFRPNRLVSEPEFLAMLLRAYPEVMLDASITDSPWYTPYYIYAASRHWPVTGETEALQFNRGKAARILAASQVGALNLTDSIQYLLDRGLSSGKTSATVDGFAANDSLSRAESVQFIRNLQDRGFSIQGAGQPAEDVPDTEHHLVSVRDVAIGDALSSVVDKLGLPVRIDSSEYGFHWYIYNSDYADYAQIGVQDGMVVALYSGAANWRTHDGLKNGMTRADVVKQYGKPVDHIQKGNTRFIQNYNDNEYGTYEIQGLFITFFYDVLDGHKIVGMQAVEKVTETSFQQFYAGESRELVTAFERQSFDLANVARARIGKPAFEWDDAASVAAGKHSQDMADNHFFEHLNLRNEDMGDRMQAEGIDYRSAAENIAAGQTSAIFAHHGWMNSSGHRKNIESDIRRLGTGVAFGGSYHIYYTQNFYTPR
jgi:uncharacterized protein YkwD